jgi:hypothetical protein
VHRTDALIQETLDGAAAERIADARSGLAVSCSARSRYNARHRRLPCAREGNDIMRRMLLLGLILRMAQTNSVWAVDDKSPLVEKAAYLQQVLLDKHWLDGLYVGIIDCPPQQARLPLPHTVNQPGNVIHAGVWTGRYRGGVGYQYAVTKNPRVREIGGQILKALRILQEVTGKPGLLCRGYVKGHGPVVD